ncbi:MAG: hypothetical protein ACODAG_02590, partial [Myxococcota bacterium]
MTAHYDIDSDRWPLLVAKAPPGIASDDAIHRFLRDIRGELALGTPVALVLDARRATLTAPQRRIFATAAEQDAKHYPGFIRATAIVTRTPMERATMTALLWLFTPPYPIRPFATVQEALPWA